MSPFGPAFVILPTRTLPTSPDESRQLDELAEKIVICVPIYALLSILISVASRLPSSSLITSSLLWTIIGRGGNLSGLRIDLRP